MASFRRLLSSRANGRLSQGPKTKAGKLRSSRNSYRHGCRAKTFLIPEEPVKRCQYQHLRTQTISQHLPQDATEMLRVEQMIQAEWRMRCTRDLQRQMASAYSSSHPELTDSDDLFADLIVNAPGFAALWFHEQTEEAKSYESAIKLHTQRVITRQIARTPPAPAAKTKKTTNEPTLRIPYNPLAPSPKPAQVVRSQQDRPTPIQRNQTPGSPLMPRFVPRFRSILYPKMTRN